MDYKNNELMFVLSLRNKIVSVNDLYKARIGYKGGRPYPVIYKSERAKNLSREIREQLRALDISEHKEWLSNTKKINLTIQFVFKTGIGKRDTSNQCKLIEDQIVQFLKHEGGIEEYDDVRHIEVHLYKSIIPKSQEEYVCVRLSPSYFDTRFDRVEEPEKVSLKGIKNTDAWYKPLKEAIKQVGLKSYDPTTSKSKNPEKELDKCNVDVIIIGKDKLSITLSAKIASKIVKKHSNPSGFLKIGIWGNVDYWKDKYEEVNKLYEYLSELSKGFNGIKIMKDLDENNIIEIFKTT